MTALLAVSASGINPLAFVIIIVALAIVLFVVSVVSELTHNIIQYVRKVSGKNYEITRFVSGIK